MTAMKVLLRAATLLLPFALAAVFVGLIAEGHVDLGGGEKDLIWVVPWLLWSVFFAIGSGILWSRGWSYRRAFLASTLFGIGGVFVVAALLAAAGRLGVAGRW